ncbi:50S ribosomal protein L11 methyltransferase [Alloalcanivorax gelatiniphagus]|uniref:50S ribosomal protein L11 methyltransferase n=1 Tax=Alloalcanivorax gelatiniphagus TaxID=1194167 RepID=UPI00360C78EB
MPAKPLDPPAALQARLNRLLPDIRLVATPLPLVPELSLWLLDKLVDERLDQEVANALMESPPYWALCWASGQVLARHILAAPERVRGQCLVDVGPGSGVVAIAAARASAARVIACDLDPDALAATEANAALNGVRVELSDDLDACLAVAGRITAADILYDRDNLPLLERFRAAGVPVWLADSRIADLDPPGFQLLGHWQATTWPDLGESQDYNRVRIFELEP